jgi:AraC family transcriptional regulator
MRKESALESLPARAAFLLRQAMTLLDMDRQVAQRYLSDAATLLRAEVAAMDPNTSAARFRFRRGGLARWQARRVLAYIEANLGSKLGVSELAALVGLSESHFSRAFSRAVGRSPMAYVTASRIERAKLMMRSTTESLSNIALACGFADQPHFSRAFRRWAGVSPGAWRRQSEVAPEVSAAAPPHPTSSWDAPAGPRRRQPIALVD